MSRYRVVMPVLTAEIFEIEADSPEQAVDIVIETGQGYRQTDEWSYTLEDFIEKGHTVTDITDEEQ